MKKSIVFLVLVAVTLSVKSQITSNPIVDKKNADEASVYQVITSLEETGVFIHKWGIDGWYLERRFKIGPGTVLEYINPQSGLKEKNKILKLTSDNTTLQLGKNYREYLYMKLHFSPLPNGVDKIDLIDPDGVVFRGIHITPVSIEPIKRIATSESELKKIIDSSSSAISGFYEMLEGNSYKLAVLQTKDSIFLLYVGHDGGDVGTWRIGETKAILRPTAIKNVFKADWFNKNKIKLSAVVTFDAASMSIKVGSTSPDTYFKMGGSTTIDPASGEPITEMWTGSGYAIGDGYIVTNNHVAGEANIIKIKGVNGDMNTSYSAEVVVTDKVNDIAIIKITDPNFKDYGTLPYAVMQQMAEVGEEVFVLGYPLTQALGNEIKLTNGIISSRTGYQGNIATYQISAPIQPGNSGGPMFDSKGNVIGIVVAGVPGAENVGYAIKTSYLKILIESAGLNIKFPANNTISTLSLAEKVKRVKNFVFYIECSK